MFLISRALTYESSHQEMFHRDVPRNLLSLLQDCVLQHSSENKNNKQIREINILEYGTRDVMI